MPNGVVTSRGWHTSRCARYIVVSNARHESDVWAKSSVPRRRCRYPPGKRQLPGGGHSPELVQGGPTQSGPDPMGMEHGLGTHEYPLGQSAELLQNPAVQLQFAEEQSRHPQEVVQSNTHAWPAAGHVPELQSGPHAAAHGFGWHDPCPMSIPPSFAHRVADARLHLSATQQRSGFATAGRTVPASNTAIVAARMTRLRVVGSCAIRVSLAATTTAPTRSITGFGSARLAVGEHGFR